MKTTHLQWVGTVNAIAAGELVAGDVTMWNGGATQVVLSVEELSPRFVRLNLVDVDHKGNRLNDKVWSRRSRKDFNVGVTRATAARLGGA